MSEQEILRILHSQCMCCMRLLEQIAITCESRTEFLRTYYVEFISREFVYVLWHHRVGSMRSVFRVWPTDWLYDWKNSRQKLCTYSLHTVYKTYSNMQSSDL